MSTSTPDEWLSNEDELRAKTDEQLAASVAWADDMTSVGRDHTMWTDHPATDSRFNRAGERRFNARIAAVRVEQARRAAGGTQDPAAAAKYARIMAAA